MQERSDHLRSQGKTIVFVPTMGYLHEGHLSLMKEGQKHGDVLVASIFINPAQFAPGEDLESYPVDFKRDVGLCQNEGVNLIFAPDIDEIYGDKFQSYVTLEKLPNHLCGISRPIFFKGVATVCAKLFNVVKPHVAVFGQKDYQQLVIIRQMVRDFSFEIEIIGCPTIREPDGLAMSSRNSYLTPEQRTYALSIFKSLNKGQALLKSGTKDAEKIIGTAKALIKSHPATEIDYISICDLETLDDIKIIDKPVLMALAVKVGKARLIDNMILNP